jgi:hypothetical protein
MSVSPSHGAIGKTSNPHHFQDNHFQPIIMFVDEQHTQFAIVRIGRGFILGLSEHVEV